MIFYHVIEIIRKVPMDILFFLKALGNIIFAAIIFVAMSLTTFFYLLAFFVTKQTKFLPALFLKMNLPGRFRNN